MVGEEGLGGEGGGAYVGTRMRKMGRRRRERSFGREGERGGIEICTKVMNHFSIKEIIVYSTQPI